MTETGVDGVDRVDRRAARADGVRARCFAAGTRVQLFERSVDLAAANALMPLSLRAGKFLLGCRLIAARQTAHGRGRMGRD